VSDGGIVTPAPRSIRYGTGPGRWVLLATIGGSAIAFLDSTVVNVALPALAEDLDADVAGLQWVLNGYMLALASLILLAGSLGDRYGRRRVFVIGVAWFAIASMLCAFAQSVGQLVFARVLQGMGGALLTPGSLAIIEASFHPDDRGRAIGAWSGLGSVAAAVGPFVGGYLTDAVHWRAVFFINLPIAAGVVMVALRHVPESKDPTSVPGLDLTGAITGALGLGGVTYALIAAGDQGVTTPVLGIGIGGLLLLGVFVAIERRSPHPMLPFGIFAAPQFVWANVVTFAVYGGLGTVFFLLVVQLQVSLGYDAIQAGIAGLPITALMLVLSPRAGRWSQRVGPRLPMTLGPLLAAAGIALLVRVVEGAGYLSVILPALLLYGTGLALTVAPLTTTVLAAADERHSGVASGVNNAVARSAQLLAVAALPAIVGLTGDAYQDPDALTAGFKSAMLIGAGLVAAGGVVAWFSIDPGLHRRRAPVEATGLRHCDLQGPPLRRSEVPA
jgi:EmrB/QacA subfamily drug resistance transporter